MQERWRHRNRFSYLSRDSSLPAAYDRRWFRAALLTLLIEPAGGPTVIVPLLLGVGLCFVGLRSTFFDGQGGPLVGLAGLVLGPTVGFALVALV